MPKLVNLKLTMAQERMLRPVLEDAGLGVWTHRLSPALNQNDWGEIKRATSKKRFGQMTTREFVTWNCILSKLDQVGRQF